jgi:serine/threonine protein kinase
MSSPDDSTADLDFGPTLRGFAANQRVFDRYELREILGRGGMGIVWRAYDEQLECEVALKFLPELVAFDEQAVADLKRETKKTRELRHHNIVQVYDFVTDNRSACISMELVDGPTLSAIKARRKEGFLEVEEITRWVRHLCEALNYAHERAKIAHRDLKPANLMINGKGELKVTDFGIARSISDSLSMLTRGGGPSGTLVYMSPQQLDAECASHLDDIYSLGATLYELLTSKPPFYSGGIERQIHEKIPPSVARRREELNCPRGGAVPPQWETTIAACLAKDPAHRPQSAQEVANQLGLRGHFAASTTHESPKPEIMRAKVVLRRRKRVIGTALMALLVTGVVGGWWLAFERPRRESARQWQIAVQREKEKQNKEAARQLEVTEEDRLARERGLAAEVELEKQRLAAAQRSKQEEAKKEEDSLKAIAPSADNVITFNKSAIEAKLIELESKSEASVISHDPSFVQTYLADDYRGVSSKGTVMSKSDLIAGVKEDTDIYESVTNQDVNVQVNSPTMAVVTGVSHEKGRSKAGNVFNRRFRWTDTWIERDGRWQCTASQAILLQ